MLDNRVGSAQDGAIAASRFNAAAAGRLARMRSAAGASRQSRSQRSFPIRSYRRALIRLSWRVRRVLGMSLFHRAVAEAVGTFALVFAGCGAIMVNAQTGALGHVGVAASFGLVVMVMIYTFGHVSGAHFNPAVTAAFALTRHLPIRVAATHVGAQLAGAIGAAAALRSILGTTANLGTTTPSGSTGQSFALELVLSAFLMLVIMAVATDTRAVGEAAAIAIGGTVALDALFGGPISGASMNPARSIGPALVSGIYDALWLYIAAPLAGAAIGALVYQLARGQQSVGER